MVTKVAQLISYSNLSVLSACKLNQLPRREQFVKGDCNLSSTAITNAKINPIYLFVELVMQIILKILWLENFICTLHIAYAT